MAFSEALLLSAILAQGALGALVTSFPSPSGTSLISAPKTISSGASFDGGMKLFDRSDNTCEGQTEGGDADAVFLIQTGGTLSNVIIGPDNGEGVHCLGSCTLSNVWWTDVCEDAATFKQTSGTSYVKGGGARNADDKVLQHNGGGTVAVTDFYVENVGKMYRSCGNCDTQYARKSTFNNVMMRDGDVLAGVNGNEGDTTTITNSYVCGGGDVCDLYQGNDDGDEPTKTRTGADGKTCVTSNISTDC